jgi:hypothetical protein
MRRQLIRSLIGALMVVVVGCRLLAAEAEAQCTRDIDCKGDRLCKGGECVDPEQAPSGQYAPPVTLSPLQPAGYVQQPAPLSSAPAPAGVQGYGMPTLRSGSVSTGWAGSAGVMGLVSAGAALAMGIAAEATRGEGHMRSVESTNYVTRYYWDGEPAVPNGLNIAAFVTTAIMVPIINKGGVSARLGTGATGVKPLRVLGWISYFTSMAGYSVLIPFGLADEDNLVEFAPGPIIASALLATTSLVAFSTDALVSRRQARLRSAAVPAPAAPPLTVMPAVSSVRLADGSNTGVFGLTGTF